MARRLVPILALACVLFLSGCADSGPKALAGPSSSEAPAPPASVTADTGGIEGQVTDEELVPIAGADVGILKSDKVAKTDAEGRFSFSEVPIGAAQLILNRLGYEQASKQVEVVAGEVTKVQVTLVPLAIVEAYAEAFVYAGYIKLGTALTAAAEADGGVVGGCEKCMNRFNASKDVQSIVFEPLFTPSLPDPREMKLYTQTRADGKLLLNKDWSNRQKEQLDEGWTKGEFAQFLACGNTSFSICYEQKFYVYTTLFHNGEPDEDFTALPPE